MSKKTHSRSIRERKYPLICLIQLSLFRLKVRLKRRDFIFFSEKIVDEETLAISLQKLKILKRLR